ncbi:(E3-independent) E2 ubiquitin-conjugating enzyme UBE2O-like, partial [Diaphorina citri]|uniref:(E3-independent) E2 ubiquitin-conjugating enzyme UBE2O-like n=1 Tax=Diaphorina citri TaxID=121845 RepID=A0A3Q0JIK2_DIACI
LVLQIVHCCLEGNPDATTPLPTPLAARSLEGHDGTTPIPARSLEGHDLTTPLTARTPTPPLAPKRRTVALATRLMRRRNKAKTMQRGSRAKKAQALSLKGPHFLCSRSLMPGDVVKRLVKDKNTQRGYCNDIKIVATVQIVGTKLVIENLPTSQLSPLTTFSKDLAVYLDHWIGVTRDVHLKLLVSCSDGSKAYISDPYMLKSLLNQRKSKCLHEDFPRKSDFYPGQRLLASRYILASAQWLFKSPEFERLSSRHKHLKLTVERMEVDYVEVTWRCTAFTGNSAQPSLTPRESIVKGDDLKRLRVLNHFESCTNQVGDRMSYTPSAQDSILPLDVWRQRKREGMLASGVTLPVHHRRK